MELEQSRYVVKGRPEVVLFVPALGDAPWLQFVVVARLGEGT